MNSAASFFASYLINSVWEVSLIALAGWTISRMLRRLGPHAEHLTWVASLLLALVTPAIPMLRSLINQAAGVGRINHSSYALLTADVTTTGGANGLSTFVHHVLMLMLCMYCGTLLYFATRLIVSLRRTWIVQKNSVPAQLTIEQQEAWSHTERALTLRDVRFQTSEHIAGPVTLGIRQPMLLMPSSFLKDCTVQDLLAAIAHEAAHIQRRDFKKNLFYELISLPLSFHPGLWMIKSQIAQTRELVCDQIATDRILDRKRYSDSLLRLAAMVFAASQLPASNAIGIFDANILKKRILAMKATSNPLSLAAKYSFIVPAILFLAFFAVGASAFAVSVDPTTQQQTSGLDPSTPIQRIGGDVKAPVIQHSVDPEFPESGRQQLQHVAKFSKTCEVRLVVDSEGLPRNVRVVRSIGQDFDAKAIEAVQQYKFKPAMKQGKPVAVDLYIDVNFQKF